MTFIVNKRNVLYSVKSPISGFIEVIRGIHGLELHINGAVQTVKMLKNKRINYWEIATNLVNVSPDSRILLLGLGGGEIIRNLLNKHPILNITVIELDPIIVEIYNKFFKEEKHNPTIILADAYDYMLKNNIKYDLIYTDIYFKNCFPKKFLNEPFLTKVSKSLSLQGFYIYNYVVGDFLASTKLLTIENIFKHYFRRVYYKRISPNMLNYLFFGSNKL